MIPIPMNEHFQATALAEFTVEIIIVFFCFDFGIRACITGILLIDIYIVLCGHGHSQI